MNGWSTAPTSDQSSSAPTPNIAASWPAPTEVKSGKKWGIDWEYSKIYIISWENVQQYDTYICLSEDK